LILTNNTVQENTDKQTQYKSEKVDNLKYSKTKLPWFSCQASYNTRPGNEVGLFYNDPSPHEAFLNLGTKTPTRCYSDTTYPSDIDKIAFPAPIPKTNCECKQSTVEQQINSFAKNCASIVEKRKYTIQNTLKIRQNISSHPYKTVRSLWWNSAAVNRSLSPKAE